MEAIVAVFSDWGIGSEGTQQIVLKADRRHFRELTAGATVLVGRRTLQDFPNGEPLKGRRNLVLSRQEIAIPGAEVVHSAQEAAAAAAESGRCLVIGGASVYQQMMPYIDKIYVTKIERIPDSDRFFPNLDASSEWHCAEEGELQQEDGILFRFCTYTRTVMKE